MRANAQNFYLRILEFLGLIVGKKGLNVYLLLALMRFGNPVGTGAFGT